MRPPSDRPAPPTSHDTGARYSLTGSPHTLAKVTRCRANAGRTLTGAARLPTSGIGPHDDSSAWLLQTSACLARGRVRPGNTECNALTWPLPGPAAGIGARRPTRSKDPATARVAATVRCDGICWLKAGWMASANPGLKGLLFSHVCDTPHFASILPFVVTQERRSD